MIGFQLAVQSTVGCLSDPRCEPVGPSVAALSHRAVVEPAPVGTAVANARSERIRSARLCSMTHNPDSKLQDHMYKVLAASAVSLVLVGTVVFSLLEDWSIVDSFYFSVVTATTVGFGDITPDTDGAKLFCVLYIIVGISIVGTFLDARLKRHAIKGAASRS
jgi:hypothetical protein